MSIFNELLPEIKEISNSYARNFEINLQKAFAVLDKFEEDYKNGRDRTRETIKNKSNALNTLQSINEDDVEANKPVQESKIPKKATSKETKLPPKPTDNAVSLTSEVQSRETRIGKKRSKDMIDGAASSPEMDKRQKRNASVKAQNQISKQTTEDKQLTKGSGILKESNLVNVNLSQKMRREEPIVDTNTEKRESRSRSRRNKEDNKENSVPILPVPIASIKLEKLSIPPQPVEIKEDIPIKQEIQDDLAMPPPVAPVPKPRRVKEKIEENENSGEESSGRRRTRNKKQTITAPARASSRSTRSTRGSTQVQTSNVQETQITVQDAQNIVQDAQNTVQDAQNTVQDAQNTVQEVQKSPEPRPKRTRTKRKQNEMEQEKKLEKEGSQDSVPSSPERSRPKRTRKAPQKLAEQEIEPQKPTKISTEKPPKTPEQINSSPILNNKYNNKITEKVTVENDQSNRLTEVLTSATETNIEEVIVNGLNETMVLPNGKYDHAPHTPTTINMNSTVVLERVARSTLLLDKQTVVNETVVLNKSNSNNITDDNSIMTDDNSDVMQTPPRQIPQANNPPSAVKEKVQQFEEMASRVTRTKTRAMTKKDDDIENYTPPEKVIPTNALSEETLAKMNNMIFNGKTPLQSSQSATKLTNPHMLSTSKTASTSKLSVNKYREREDDARKKKRQMLDERMEMQKRKREEKIAAAEAARMAAERERQTALEMAEKERQEKLAAVRQGKIERKKEVERHRQEQARKAAETEERRRQAEQLRAEKQLELRKADAERKRQLEEAERTKKEAAKMAKEMEKRKKEYIEKQKIKQKLDAVKVQTPIKHENNHNMDPVYMADGFEHLNSDSEDESPKSHPVPKWSENKARYKQLLVQINVRQSLIDRMFSIRTHSPDLRSIFPNIDARVLKRTSSAVWRTPRSTERN